MKSVPSTDLRYRCRFLETFVAADEILHRDLYGKAVDSKLTTFADLGCNVGLFALLLARITGRRDLQGIMIDANRAMVEETRWLLAANKLDRIIAAHGLVGSTGAGETAEFFLSDSNLGSSQFPVDEPGKAKKSAWQKTVVPRIDLERMWARQFGDSRCHLLKVDIEGSEMQLFQTERRFLARVDAIVLEWHKWVVTGESVRGVLEKCGFRLVEVLAETDSIGVAWYRKD